MANGNGLDAGNISAIISACSGLGGVAIGAFLNFLKDLRLERVKDRRDGRYLATIVVSQLDHFASGCLHVALDDGISEGPYAQEDECRAVKVMPPSFKPLEIAVEWKSLPHVLMHDIFQVSDRQDQIENRLAAPGYDDPPDHAEYFWTRRYDYAELGLYVSRVAGRLRDHAGLPSVGEASSIWNREMALHQVIVEVTKARQNWERLPGFHLS